MANKQMSAKRSAASSAQNGASKRVVVLPIMSSLCRQRALVECADDPSDDVTETNTSIFQTTL